jgi:hypothetical protein
VIVAEGLATNVAPAQPRKRNSPQRESFNLAIAFAIHKNAISRLPSNLCVPFVVDVGVIAGYWAEPHFSQDRRRHAATRNPIGPPIPARSGEWLRLH